MKKMSREKRLHPRIKTDLKVNISKGISVNSVDLSEAGIGLSSQEAISSPLVSLEISLPESAFKLKTKAKLVWSRGLDGGGCLYGMKFIALNERQKRALREELLRLQIRGLLNDVKNLEAKRYIQRFFLNDISNYTNEMLELISGSVKDNQYSLELEKRIERLNNQILLKGYSLELLLSDKTIMPRVKDNFRQLVGVWLYKSTILKQTLDKPKGYPENYKILELIYDNKPISKNIGAYFDNNFLKSPYAVAIRNRKDYLKKMLLKFIQKSELTKIRILNIASGAAREVRELVSDFKAEKMVSFICLDQDKEALEFAQNLLSPISGSNIQFKFALEDIINPEKNKDYLRIYGQQDLIYSLGLIDYLSDQNLREFIVTLYELLAKEGKLILTHRNREKTFAPICPDWFCGWQSFARNKDEVINLFYQSKISNFSISVKSDDFEYIYYFIVTKH